MSPKENTRLIDGLLDTEDTKGRVDQIDAICTFSRPYWDANYSLGDES